MRVGAWFGFSGKRRHVETRREALKVAVDYALETRPKHAELSLEVAV